MRSPSEAEIRGLLIQVISDGFNRSVGALETAGALNMRKMRSQYKGVGSKYYDLVTEQMEYTARFGATAVRKLYEDDGAADSTALEENP